MAVQEDGFATRATTSCTSSARRSGESAEMVNKIGKPAVFYTLMLSLDLKPKATMDRLQDR